MHTRGFDGKSTPIRRVENIRVEGDELQGIYPVFDMKDPFAAEIARKWEEDFIRMCSAGLEPVEVGWRPSTCCRDNPVQRSCARSSSRSPLRTSVPTTTPCNYTSRAVKSCGWHRARTTRSSRSSKTHTPRRRSLPRKRTTVTIKPFFDEQILLTLGLPATATEDDAVNAITKLQGDVAYRDARTLPHRGGGRCCYRGKKDDRRQARHLITLGKKAGFDVLQSTIAMLTPRYRSRHSLSTRRAERLRARASGWHTRKCPTSSSVSSKREPGEVHATFQSRVRLCPKIDK